MTVRDYNPEQDRAAVHRIWREIGWIQDNDAHRRGVDLHLDNARVLVAEVNGRAHVVTLGPESAAVTGSDASLPTLEASVGAFTRLWMGVRPASGLAVSDRLSGPPELLAALDRVLCLPEPQMEWLF